MVYPLRKVGVAVDCITAQFVLITLLPYQFVNGYTFYQNLQPFNRVHVTRTILNLM